MAPGTKKYNKIPRYHSFRIYIISTVLYFFLVFPVAGILVFRYVPDYLDKVRSEKQQQLESAENPEPGKVVSPAVDTLAPAANDTAAARKGADIHIRFGSQGNGDEKEGSPGFSANESLGGTMELLIKMLLVSFILGFVFNLTFKIYLKNKRKGLPIKPKLEQFCKKFLLRSPAVNTAILGLAYGITLLYMLYFLLFRTDLDEMSRQFYEQFFFITLLSAILTLMLVFFWMKHRVHIRYLEHFFSETELRKRIFRARQGRIRNRLWVSSAMTTLLPLIIVVFYIFLNISSVSELGLNEITPEHKSILLGKYDTMGEFDFNNESLADFFYVNTINSLLMVIGIGTGIFIALIYIVLFVRWTTEDIVRPVTELLENMRRTGRGELDSFSIVRTNDEIGEMTEGYNEMSEKLKNYFHSLEKINRANLRFVPRQFLDFLGKESITDIQLGDQVQKEMTIMFSDIRDFTALSETMSPKENFDFINNYLGYMEPVIRHNNGFIDKFMGDSIMALFPDSAEDAINTSIEMRIKLMEYNGIISQFGKPAIDAGIGIHTGMLMLGIIGGEGRMDGTVISDAVNLAARLEGLTKVYGSSIIITEDTLIRLSDPSQYHFRFLDIVKVKGKKEAIYIFEIMDAEPEQARELKIMTKNDYNKAIQHYKKKEFHDSLKLLQKIQAVNPADKAVNLYINRSSTYLEKGVPELWDGVESFDLKY